MSVTSLIHRLNRKDQPIFRFHPLTKKFLIAFFLVFTFVIVNQVKAQNIISDKQKAIDKGGNSERWLHEALISNMVSSTTMLGGPIPDQYLNVKYGDTDAPTSYVPGGAIGTVTGLIASMYTPPASGIQYLAQVRDEFLGRPAYAQSAGGIGYQGLQPILPLWRVFRNVIYTASSLILLILGIMIMLRVKISPQAVITIQNAIPKLITTLIFVTFSYAIAGLMIDLMYFVQAFGLFLAFQLGGITNMGSNLLGDNTSFLELSRATFWGHAQLLMGLITHSIIPVIGGVVGGVLGGLVGGVTGSAIIAFAGIGAVGGIFAGAAVGILIIILIVFIVILIQFLNLFWGLLRTYFTIILQIIFAPVLIAVGAFPSSKTGFNSWFLNLTANLTIFPAVYLFLIFSNVLMEVVKGKNLWAPAVVGVAPSAINLAIALGTLFIVSKIPALIPQTLFNIKPSPWGQAMSQNVAALQKAAYGPTQIGGRTFAGRMKTIGGRDADTYYKEMGEEGTPQNETLKRRARRSIAGSAALGNILGNIFPTYGSGPTVGGGKSK